MAKPSANTVSQEEKQVRQLSVPAEEGQLSRVRDFVAEVCEEAGFTPRETNNTKLAVDEACTNIIKHAYAEERGEIEIRASIFDGKVEFALIDEGRNFDFASVRDPDLDQYVETGKKGGLGVFLINRLMDGVEYRSGDAGNELVLTKQSQTLARMPSHITWRGSLRYKFTMRASIGFFFLVAAIWGYTYVRQTSSLKEQRVSQWIEKRRMAENLASKSKEFLLSPEAYSVAQTTLTAFVAQMLEGGDDLVYARVVDSQGQILASGNIDEMFTTYQAPDGDVLQNGSDRFTWLRYHDGGKTIRDIQYPVRVIHQGTGREVTVGSIHLGVNESLLAQEVHDPRLMTTLTIVAVFLIGILLIMSLVSFFVKPIQVLTDGVRAIGQGTLDGKISIEGPAEIGAIASVFNEITDKFKKAQVSVAEQEKMQKEIEVAKEIQQALLPKKHPDVSGYDIAPYYQAAKEVGGDYYDFVAVDEETLGVVVADVSGKGVPGSLVMTMIRTALRMEARGNKNASDVMSKMNDFVTDDMKKGMFVTMFYVILDSKNRVISYASAGHNPMILFRAETDDCFFLNPKGFPVGISLPDEALFRRSISLEKIKLKKDDMLLIYTDGVTEAMNERREQYGEDRLVRIVRENGRLHPKKFIEILERDIKSFTGGHPQNDDITVVAVKEKLAADDVLYGIRKKLIDLVDVKGLSVKEACSQMKVSPATYYRYKKRMAIMGERGLRNKVLREDQDLKRASIGERKRLIAIIQENPEFGAKRIAQLLNERRPEGARELTERMIYDELKRLNLNTKDMRIDYLKRNRLIEGESQAPSRPTRTSKQMVEELITEVSRQPEGEPESDRPRIEVDMSSGLFEDSEDLSDVAITRSDTEDGVTVLGVDGHLDSVSSGVLENKLKEVIGAGIHKIVVDLTDVAYISSGGWGIFVGEVRRLREQSGDVVLVGMSAEVYDVYELLGFADILRAFNTPEEALEYIRLPAQERFTPAERTAEIEPLRGSGESLMDEVQSEGYGGEWESLNIEATTVGAEGDMAVISLRGIIDTISAEHLREAIDKVIRSNIYKLVIDMSLVEYVSSGGWGTFTERLRELRRNDGDLKLFGMDPDVYYVFTMLGFNIVLSSFDIMSEALEDFKRSADGRPSVHPGAARAAAADDVEAPVIDFSDDEAERVQEAADVFLDREPSADEDALQRVSVNDIGDATVIRIYGMIEASSIDDIASELEYTLSDRPPYVIFDLTDVDYVSSTGWGLFAGYYKQVGDWGGAISLCNMSPDLYEIFSCLEFYNFIASYATLEEALAAWSPAASAEASPPPAPVEDAYYEEPAAGTEAAPAPPEETYVGDILDLDEIADPIVDNSADAPPREPWQKRAQSPEESSEANDWPADASTDAPAAGEISDQEIEFLDDEEPLPAAAEGAGVDAPPQQPAPRNVDAPALDRDTMERRRRPRDGSPEVLGSSDEDFTEPGADARVDVDGSVTGEHVDDDKRIRKLGWDDYGERLKKRLKKKPEEDESDA